MFHRVESEKQQHEDQQQGCRHSDSQACLCFLQVFKLTAIGCVVSWRKFHLFGDLGLYLFNYTGYISAANVKRHCNSPLSIFTLNLIWSNLKFNVSKLFE